MICYKFEHAGIEVTIGREDWGARIWWASSEQFYTQQADTELEIVQIAIAEIESTIRDYYGSLPEYYIAVQRQKVLDEQIKADQASASFDPNDF